MYKFVSMQIIPWNCFALMHSTDMYYIAFPKDKALPKAIVSTTYILEILQVVLSTRDAFRNFGTGWGDMPDLDAVGWLWFSVPVLGSISQYSDTPMLFDTVIADLASPRAHSMLHGSAVLRVAHLDFRKTACDSHDDTCRMCLGYCPHSEGSLISLTYRSQQYSSVLVCMPALQRTSSAISPSVSILTYLH